MDINIKCHLAFKLSEYIKINDLKDFYLGVAYNDDIKEMSSDFILGNRFSLWLDLIKINFEDLNKYDCLIMDMPIVGPIITNLQQNKYEGVRKIALNNLLRLANEPMPLYLVCSDKSLKYEKILNQIVRQFIEYYQ